MTDAARKVVSPIGSSFASFLEEDGMLEAVDEAAVKEVIACQVAEEMKGRGLSKTALAGATAAHRWTACSIQPTRAWPCIPFIAPPPCSERSSG